MGVHCPQLFLHRLQEADGLEDVCSVRVHDAAIHDHLIHDVVDLRKQGERVANAWGDGGGLSEMP
jgi:hypothetical protein